tara:strand:+ start:1256 stop:1390 length:135 start_codon:yes stop_codon:yes gene_type:complete
MSKVKENLKEVKEIIDAGREEKRSKHVALYLQLLLDDGIEISLR